jgi:hypothetical protein
MDKDVQKNLASVLKSNQKKFYRCIKAIEGNFANRTQYNLEKDCDNGKVYAIKINLHRFYTLDITENGKRCLYISKYGKKQSQTNDKKLTKIIESVCLIDRKLISDEIKKIK